MGKPVEVEGVDVRVSVSEMSGSEAEGVGIPVGNRPLTRSSSWPSTSPRPAVTTATGLGIARTGSGSSVECSNRARLIDEVHNGDGLHNDDLASLQLVVGGWKDVGLVALGAFDVVSETARVLGRMKATVVVGVAGLKE